MNVPDKIFQSHSWLDINIYMFVKRNTTDGVVKVSHQQIADEFGITRNKVRHLLDKFFSENLLFRADYAQNMRKNGAKMAQTGSENQDVTNDFGAKMAQNMRKNGAVSVQEKLAIRKHSFGEKLIPYIEEYGKDMIRKFFDYWTETNANGTKMRFEAEKMFEINKRLSRWANNNKEYRNDGNKETERRRKEAERLVDSLLST